MASGGVFDPVRGREPGRARGDGGMARGQASLTSAPTSSGSLRGRSGRAPRDARLRRSHAPHLRPLRRAAGRPDRPVGVEAIRARDPRRPLLRARGGRQQGRPDRAARGARASTERCTATSRSTIKFLVEGEEETGSRSLRQASSSAYGDKLAADGCIWEGMGIDHAGRPELVFGAKGLAYVELTLPGADRRPAFVARRLRPESRCGTWSKRSPRLRVPRRDEF